MPNNVHVILAPIQPDTLGPSVGEALPAPFKMGIHAPIGLRENWRGHVFQGRFYSVAMDEGHLMAAFRYLALNPVKAKLTKRAWINDFGALVTPENNVESHLWNEICRNEFTGRAVGTKEWLENLDRELGGIVLPEKRDRKVKAQV